MCPATIAIAAAAMTAGSALIGGITKAEAADYQGQVARNNYITETQNARHASSAAAANTEAAGLKARSKQASVRAGIAANNLDIGSGSPIDVQETQHKFGQLDVATTANNAAMQVYGYETQANSFKAQQKLDNAEIVPDLLQGVLGAGGALLGNPTIAGGLGGGDGINPVSITPGQFPTGYDPSLISSAPSVPDAYSWMQDHSSTGAIY